MRTTLLTLVLVAAGSSAEEFKHEPAAHAIYKKMLATLLEAQTLSYECAYRWEARGRDLGRARYKTWLKKPNQFRIEAIGESGHGGTIVGDGEFMWTFWLDRRPRWNDENYARWEKTSKDVYMRQRTLPRGHSISHQLGLLGAGTSMAVLNPSRFHGAPSSMDRYFDGVRSLGTEKVGDEPCDVVEVSYMKHQRSQIFWISQRDHLPRRQKGIVRVASGEIVTHERWTNIQVNPAIPDALFSWKPGDGWTEWRRPRASARALKPGSTAPAFAAKLLDGRTTRLADYRGKILWLVFWRVG